MKSLFSDIYNKILELFQIEKSENTGECAANRLQVILMHDRTKLDPLIMNKMREELIDVFSKYVVIDKEELEIGLKQEGDTAALMLNIPIVRAKTEEELEELRKKLQEEEQKVSDDENSDDEEVVDSENLQVDENEKDTSDIVEEDTVDNTNSDENSEVDDKTSNQEIVEENKEEITETLIEKTEKSENKNIDNK